MLCTVKKLFFFLFCLRGCCFSFFFISHPAGVCPTKIKIREYIHTHTLDMMVVSSGSPEISENQHAEESSSSAGLDDDDRPHKKVFFFPPYTQRIFFPFFLRDGWIFPHSYIFLASCMYYNAIITHTRLKIDRLSIPYYIYNNDNCI